MLITLYVEILTIMDAYAKLVSTEKGMQPALQSGTHYDSGRGKKTAFPQITFSHFELSALIKISFPFDIIKTYNFASVLLFSFLFVSLWKMPQYLSYFATFHKMA